MERQRGSEEDESEGKATKASDSDTRLHILQEIGHRGKCSAIKKGHIALNGFRYERPQGGLMSDGAHLHHFTDRFFRETAPF